MKITREDVIRVADLAYLELSEPARHIHLVKTFVAALTREADWVDVALRITACCDAKDDKFLELAVSGHATHIVSGDSNLLALHPFQGIQIVSSAAFLNL